VRSDVDRWDAKYRDTNPNPTFAPDVILTEHAALLDGRGAALDVACGVGHNAIYLAQRGYDTLGLDASAVGLRYGRDYARARALPVQFAAVDLDRFAPPPDRFDLILVVRYLNRALIPGLKRGLRRGGLFMYKTFNVNYRNQHPTFNLDYLLAPGELAALFDDFRCIATNDAPTLVESQTYWIGRR